MPPSTPQWRQHQLRAGHDDHAARFLVVTRGDYGFLDGLREALENAHDVLNRNPTDSELASRLINVEWSRLIDGQAATTGAPARLSRTLHRVTFRPDDSGYEDVGKDGTQEARGDALIAAFADALSALPRGSDTTPGIDHTLKLHDPQRLSHYADLYREIAAIEMAIRECLSVVFLRAYADEPHAFMARTKVEMKPKDDKERDESLPQRHENQLFHILFDEYAALNDPRDVNLAGLVDRIRKSLGFDQLKELLAAFPVVHDKHGGFIGALRGLLSPLEQIRNPVAHSRFAREKARQNYENAREKIWERIAQFWEDEANEQQPPVADIAPTGPAAPAASPAIEPQPP
ncbi:MAG: hypothetical protein ACK5Z4_01745, partial [Planctomyces sp.]